MKRSLASDDPQKAYENDYHGHPKYILIFLALIFILIITLIPNIIDLIVGKKVVEITFWLAITIFIFSAVKALLVISNFMHVKFEPKAIFILILVSVLVIGVAFVGTMFDVTWIIDANTTNTIGLKDGKAYPFELTKLKNFLGY